jgi:hypothetical protein
MSLSGVAVFFSDLVESDLSYSPHTHPSAKTT